MDSLFRGHIYFSIPESRKEFANKFLIFLRIRENRLFTNLGTGPGPSTGGEDFLSKKIMGRRLFLLKNLKIQNLIFQKSHF